MKQHRWEKEINAFKKGKVIEMAYSLGHVIDGQWQIKWGETNYPDFNNPAWLFRIKKIDKKPLLKEPQYLYVYNKGSLNNFDFYCSLNELTGMDAKTHQFIGKLKLENE